MWGKFLPMACLFFCMSFVNTILDSLKDTLVITAVGGGANVIPWLTVYAVLPFSIAFLVFFNYMSGFMTRDKLFNTIIASFLVFLLFFAFVMYPNHGQLHPSATADVWAQQVPKGLAGLVGMVRNWTFTVFYCVSEMWGDVGLSLLFWGLANETTLMQDAPTLYPLFGIGANVAQVLAGQCLRVLALSLGTHDAFVVQVQYISVLMVVMCLAILGLHHYITLKHRATLAAGKRSSRSRSRSPSGGDSAPDAARRSAPVATPPSAAASAAPDAARLNGGASVAAHAPERVAESAAECSSLRVYTNGAHAIPAVPHPEAGSSTPAAASGGDALTARTDAGTGGAASAQPGRESNGSGAVAAASGGGDASQPDGRAESSANASASQGAKGSMSFGQALRYCWETTTIRCLATMAIAQGLCSNLAEFAWKHHLRLLHPTPQGFSGYMGNVASWTGVVTVAMMIAAPSTFKTLGWRRTARATPDLLLIGGGCFFAACAVYQLSGSIMGSAAHHVMLRVLALGGAALYVITRSAKFSLFKPAEEMVYIQLDQRARLNGKATVDVFGAQFGKSSGSVMQQVLLLMTAGSLLHSLPVMAVVFAYIAFKWGKSVDELSLIANTHTSLQSVDFDDEEAADDESLGAIEFELNLEKV